MNSLALRHTINADLTLDSFEAEAALLGCVLYSNDAMAYGGDLVTGEHFSDHMLGWLFDRCRELVAKDRRADPVALDAIAATYGTLYQDAGGLKMLGELVMNAGPPENAGDVARIILDGSVRRKAALACQDGITAMLADRGRDGAEIVADLRANLEKIEIEGISDSDAGMVPASVVARRSVVAMRKLSLSGKPRGRMTGLRCFDRRLNGLMPGALIVIGGRPGMAKTGLARACAHGAAVRHPDLHFLFLGLEMNPDEMLQRELSALSHEHAEGVEYRAMASGGLTAFDFQNIDTAERHVPSNLIFDDRCHAISVEDVRRKVWARNRDGRMAAVFIDYLQLMSRPAAKGRNEASVIGDMTKALKHIAMEAKISVVLLSQLSRQVENREDKKPQLSDLRESGSIEQDADVVLFPFREHYYLVKSEPKAGTDKHLEWEMRCHDARRRMDVICAKQRGGPEGVDQQRYFAEFDYIEDTD